MSYRPTVRQLEYIVAVAQHLHFGRAARDVGVSQPALSTQIQQVEEHLGASIFERNRRRVLLTDFGAAIVASARRALTAVDEVVALADGRDPLAGTLRLGIIPTLAPYVLPAAVPRIAAAHPELTLLLVEDQTDRLLTKLDSGELDLALLALPVDGHFSEEPVYDERFVLAIPKGHALDRPGRAQLSDLHGEAVLLLEDGHCLRDQALEVCHLAGANEDSAIRASSMTTLTQMVASGLGVTLLPEHAVELELRGGSRVQVRRFDDPQPFRRVGLVWRKTGHESAAFQTLAQSFADLFPAPSQAHRKAESEARKAGKKRKAKMKTKAKTKTKAKR